MTAAFLETYRSGHNEPHSKCGCRETGTWVRIPPSPFFERPTVVCRDKTLSFSNLYTL